MEDTLQLAQAAADKAGSPMYVFRAYGLNGHEVSWFSATGAKNSPSDELFRTVQPRGR